MAEHPIPPLKGVETEIMNAFGDAKDGVIDKDILLARVRREGYALPIILEHIHDLRHRGYIRTLPNNMLEKHKKPLPATQCTCSQEEDATGGDSDG
ncbi:MAG: hypothetical protein Q8O83_04705 [bacterium]|nr:hypothetical protein [bacterium]